MLTTHAIFDQYEQVRHLFPKVKTPNATQDIVSLTDIVDQADAFIFDAFGVLNVGETLIPNANTRLDQLRELGCAIRILTNAASYDHRGAVEKFKRLGLNLKNDEIITSREATLLNLGHGKCGVIAAETDQLSDLPSNARRLRNEQADYDDADYFLFLSTADWTPQSQELLTTSMRACPRSLLIANADLTAPRGGSFSLEPGYYGYKIANQFPDHVRFFGKPFPEVYELVEASLAHIKPNKIVMCGDTLHTDILGAAVRGWRTVLVTRDGLFANNDTQVFSEQSNLFADWRLSRI